MGEAIGQVLAFGLGVSLSPVPLIGVVLMLASPRGHADGPAFLLGWVIGLGATGTVILLLSSGADASDAGAPATWTSLVRLALGLALLLVAVRQWRGRPRGDAEAELPAWMAGVDTVTAARALAKGAALSAINPKNLIMVAGAAAAIAATGSSTGDQAVALAVFVLVGSLGPGLPVAMYFLLGDRAHDVLEDFKSWMARESTTIMAVLCLVIGTKLVGDAISGLAA